MLFFFLISRALVGTRNYTTRIDYFGQSQFNSAKEQTWVGASGSVFGSYLTANVLTAVIVHDSGHMVPFDQPKAAFDLFSRTISNSWFGGNETKK